MKKTGSESLILNVGLISTMVALISFVVATIIELSRGTFLVNSTTIGLVINLSMGSYFLLAIWGFATTVTLFCIMFWVYLQKK